LKGKNDVGDDLVLGRTPMSGRCCHLPVLKVVIQAHDEACMIVTAGGAGSSRRRNAQERSSNTYIYTPGGQLEANGFTYDCKLRSGKRKELACLIGKENSLASE
jgi:hypothetical protein